MGVKIFINIINESIVTHFTQTTNLHFKMGCPSSFAFEKKSNPLEAIQVKHLTWQMSKTGLIIQVTTLVSVSSLVFLTPARCCVYTCCGGSRAVWELPICAHRPRCRSTLRYEQYSIVNSVVVCAMIIAKRGAVPPSQQQSSTQQHTQLSFQCTHYRRLIINSTKYLQYGPKTKTKP